jgi:hypothetical protein
MTSKGKPPTNSPIVKSPLGKRLPSNMITRSGKIYSNPAMATTTTAMTTTTISTNPPPLVNQDPHRWSHPKSYNCFDFSNIQGGEHDLPKGTHSWLPFFSGKDTPGNSHWAHFCDVFDFHLDGQAHLDIFMKLFATSLTGEAKTWIERLQEKSIKNVEELQRSFKARWCDKENLQDLFSQYEDICRGTCEDIREFTDRFNLALKKVRSKVGPEQAIIDRYLSSLKGILHFKVKDRSPATLEEAQELAFEVERSLEFDDFIEERNMYFEPWNPDDESAPEPENPSILQVELAPGKRKWSTAFSKTDDVLNASKPSKDLGMVTQKIHNFEDALFILDTPMLEDQDLREADKSEETDPSISMSCILQRVKRIREMLEIPFLKKKNSDDQLPFEVIPTGHSKTDEQTPFSIDQHWSTFPLVGKDTDWVDVPDDASDTSEDSDEDGYPPQRKSNFIEGHKDVFKDVRVPSTITVDENPWCFQCSEPHWEDECPYSSGGHQQVNNIDYFEEGPQINITIEEHQEAIKEAARSARLAVINKLDQESKDKLKKKEFQVYRRKKMDQLSTDQTKEPPVDVILPKKSNAEGVDLNFDFEGALSKMLVTIPLREVIKIPSIKERFENFFQGTDGLLKDGTIGRFQNIPVTTTDEQKSNDSIKDDKARDKIGPTPHKCSLEDELVAKEENSSQIEWPTKEEYQRFIGDLKVQKTEPLKILKKEDSDQRQKSTKEKYLQLIDRYKEREAGNIRENDVRICPSQQDIFVSKSHPPPSTQYTKVVQATTNFEVEEYKEGDMVWMWDANRGKPTNIKEDDRFWLGPFKVGKRSVNDSYYLSTPEGRRRTLPVSRHLLKPHQGGGT